MKGVRMSESNHMKSMWLLTVVILLTTVIGLFLISTNKQETNNVTKGSVKLPEPYYFNIDTLAWKRDWCSLVQPCKTLAEVGYYEARSESDMGVVATMHVVMNRVRSGGEFKSQNDIPTVVYKKYQFSYVLDGSMENPVNYIQMERMLILAYDVMHKNIEDVTSGGLYYHAHYVNPRWSNHYEYVTTIGNHLFYK